jgi:hypothetical protein
MLQRLAEEGHGGIFQPFSGISTSYRLISAYGRHADYTHLHVCGASKQLR